MIIVGIKPRFNRQKLTPLFAVYMNRENTLPFDNNFHLVSANTLL